MRTLVTGATGFIGSRLLSQLTDTVVLSRNAEQARRKLTGEKVTVFEWEPTEGPPPTEAFEGVEAVFHLAGDSLAAGRWTAAKRGRLRDSRVLGTRNLVETLRRLDVRPRVLVSASAIGYYGNRGEEPLDESSSPADDFLAQMCQDWEAEACAAEELGIRVVRLRIGIVLGRGGGALEKMLTPFRLGLGSPLGNGRQVMPWIHIDDLVALLLFAARTDGMHGPVNGVSPGRVTNREFTKTLARVLHRPAFFPPVPGLMLRLMLGQFGEILLHSQIIAPKAALSHNFSFQFAPLESALRDLLTLDTSTTEP